MMIEYMALGIYVGYIIFMATIISLISNGFADSILGLDLYPTIDSLKKPKRRRKNTNDN